MANVQYSHMLTKCVNFCNPLVNNDDNKIVQKSNKPLVTIVIFAYSFILNAKLSKGGNSLSHFNVGGGVFGNPGGLELLR